MPGVLLYLLREVNIRVSRGEDSLSGTLMIYSSTEERKKVTFSSNQNTAREGKSIVATLFLLNVEQILVVNNAAMRFLL